MTASISATRFGERLDVVAGALAAEGLDAALVGIGPELEWLVGYAGQGHERLNLLVVKASGAVSFIGPRLELGAAREAPGLGSGAVELISWSEGDDPLELVSLQLPDPGRARRFAVSDGMRAAFLLGLQETLGRATFEVASRSLGPLRAAKDPDEIALLREAAQAADRAIAAVSGGRLLGRSEADVASEVRRRLVDEGHDTAEFAIVASGPNSASPHHEPGDRVIRAGEPLLLDIGGRRAGYCSDTTRTFWVSDGEGTAPHDAFRKIHEAVERAQAAGRAAVQPGVAFEDLDAAARDVIVAAGYGQQFFHRLGHGIGLEVHEAPYLVVGNAERAIAGNAFSIEPGIYLEGTFGVRIEDVVVCTDDGVEALNQTPRHLLVVSGH